VFSDDLPFPAAVTFLAAACIRISLKQQGHDSHAVVLITLSQIPWGHLPHTPVCTQVSGFSEGICFKSNNAQAQFFFHCVPQPLQASGVTFH
jgi:hypothetical protein